MKNLSIILLSISLFSFNHPVLADTTLEKTVVDCTISKKVQSPKWTTSFPEYIINAKDCTGDLGKIIKINLSENLNPSDSKMDTNQKYDYLKVNHRYALEIVSIKIDGLSYKNYLLSSYKVK
jgi:hypothetical protein